MGIFSSSSEVVPTTSTTSPAPWVTEGAKENYETAKSLTDQPYTPYEGARIADFTPDTMNAFDLVRGGVGQSGPQLEQAGALATKAGAGVPGVDLDKYMNPFTGAVIDSTRNEMMRTGEIQRVGIRNRAHGAGGYGGARHGVVEAEQMRNESRTIADMIAQLQMQGYDRATGLASTDLNRMPQISALLANLAGTGQELRTRDAAGLEAIGRQQQDLDQTNLNLAYQDFMAQLGWPFSMLDYRMKALQGEPGETTTTNQQVVPQPNALASGIGSIGTILALMNQKN